MTLAIDDDLLTSARAYAQAHGTTLNALVRQALRAVVLPPGDTSWRERLLAVSAQARPEVPWRWNREELYTERLDRLGFTATRARDANDLPSPARRPGRLKKRRTR